MEKRKHCLQFRSGVKSIKAHNRKKVELKEAQATGQHKNFWHELHLYKEKNGLK